MIGIGGGLMFKSVKDFDSGSPSSDEEKKSTSQYNKELKDELEALKREIRTANKGWLFDSASTVRRRIA